MVLSTITFSSPGAQPEAVYFMVSNESQYFPYCRSEISSPKLLTVLYIYDRMIENVTCSATSINNILCILS